MVSLESARQYFLTLAKGPAIVAFSGGVDSLLVLKLAAEAFLPQHPLYALYASAPWMPEHAKREAIEAARIINVPLSVIELPAAPTIGIDSNPLDRCYRCKRAVFNAFRTFALNHNIDITLEGSHVDDLNVYRPGLKVIAESGALSPLKTLGMHKSDVRRLLAELGISLAQKPSGSCLATRLPYGANLDTTILRRIDESESVLAHMGFQQIRLRVHGDVVRLELSTEELCKALDLRREIVAELKKLGWRYITLDLEGFRSGSMDIS